MIRPVTIVRHGLMIAVLALVLFGANGPRTAAAAPAVTLTLVTDDLNRPVAIAHAGDNSGRLFVAQQTGQIRIITSGGALLGTAYLDISSLVTCCGERGLLGVAFHPAYEGNGLFYVSYTDSSGDVVIAQYSVSGDPDVASTGATILKTIGHPYENHNGGQLKFGPDGYLYAAIGDGGGDSDRAQDPTTLLGKMLRLDVDAAAPYIPPSNPYASPSDGVLDEIWAFGLRNPWRFTFDRASGEIFIGDVGQGSWEEVSRQVPWSAGGENYGWRLMEGAHCYNPATNCDDGDPVLTYPILEYAHSGGNCSVTGG